MLLNNQLIKIPLFENLSTQELEIVKNYIPEKNYQSGITLFNEGMRGKVFYIIKQGRIELFKNTHTATVPIATLGPGQLVGAMAMLDGEPRASTAKTLVDSVLYVVTKDSFELILQTSPHIANKILLNFLKIVNHRLRETHQTLSSVL